MTIALASMADTWWPRVWWWMRQAPAAHFEDESPRNFASFEAMKSAAALTGERAVAITVDGEPVGYIGWRPVDDKRAVVLTLALAREAQGRWIAARAARAFLMARWAEGFDKVSGAHFVDNDAAAALAKRLGGIREGVLRRQVTRGGEAADLALVAFFRPGLVD